MTVGDKSAIQWTDATWNPVTGCTKVSPGCAHCYIERAPPLRVAGRRFVRGQISIVLHKDRLKQPLRWRKPRLIFVCSLADLFHEAVPDEFIDQVYAMMAVCPEHRFQVLTKRPERRLRWCVNRASGATRERVVHDTARYAGRCPSPHGCKFRWPGWPLPNVWEGVSVENQHWADVRIPLLLQTPAAVRFVSAEPLLGPVDLSAYLTGWQGIGGRCRETPPVGWVIVGGESGPQARPCNIDWMRSIIRQCARAEVPVFVKQIGARPQGWWTNALGPGFNRHAICDRKGGDPLEWPPDLRVREWPDALAETEGR